MRHQRPFNPATAGDASPRFRPDSTSVTAPTNGRRIIWRGLTALFCAAFAGAAHAAVVVAPAEAGVDSATIIPSQYVQGTVKTSLQAAGYKNTSMSLSTWYLTTGSNYAISFYNPQYLSNTLLAFGNGGTVTMQLNQAFTPVAGEKDLGIFTAQAITNGAYALQGNFESQILVSSDDVSWYTLSGQLVANPTSYVASPSLLDAPMMAYDYGTNYNALQAGEAKLSAAQLAALPVADYTEPMPDDTLYNNAASTSAQRNASSTDASAADYAEEFGTSGGGNWFDVSGSGLTSIDYVMLNGDANDPSGVRLADVFVNANAVPEPTTLGVLGLISVLALKRRPARG